MKRLHKLTVSEMVSSTYWVSATSEEDAICKFRQRDKGIVRTDTTHGDREAARIESVEPETYQTQETVDG